MPNASAPKLIRVPMNERELYTLTMLFDQAVRPKGRAEERTYRRVFDELDLAPWLAKLELKPVPSITDIPATNPREVEMGAATADYIVAEYDKVEGKVGPCVRVLLPVVERLEQALKAEPTPA